MCGLGRKKPSYSIRASVRNPWFFTSYILYELIEHYSVWDDPSYGNGGGDYRDAQQTLMTSKELDEVEEFKRIMEQHNAEEKPKATKSPTLFP